MPKVGEKYPHKNPAAIGQVSAGVVDALVMAAASVRGDTVYTSDLKDLARLLEVFPDVHLEWA
jgi:hypothetical protein